jgi:3,4-dihydroxy 2-butanone 4-phosphate synthase
MSVTAASAAVSTSVSAAISTFPEPAIRADDALADLPLPPADDIPPRIAAALEALRDGRAVVLQDDHDRENEADLIVSAERLSVETMALLIRECSGIVCLRRATACRRASPPPTV